MIYLQKSASKTDFSENLLSFRLSRGQMHHLIFLFATIKAANFILSSLIFVDIRLHRSMFTRGALEILQASSTDSFALVERWSSAARVKTEF